MRVSVVRVQTRWWYSGVLSIRAILGVEERVNGRLLAGILKSVHRTRATTKKVVNPGEECGLG